MTDTFEAIDYAVRDRVAIIALNRVDRLNAFTIAMGAEFVRALDLADGDDEVRAIIVTGAGRAFSAGADFEALGQAPSTSFDGEVEPDFGGIMTLRLFRCLKPVIAAVNGPAVGVGATIQLAMDVRIASSAARFGFVFVKRGIVPEAASSWFLPKIVGLPTALRWCMSGRMVSAEEALAAGLVSAVVDGDELLATAMTIADEFAQGTSPVSVAMTRRMLWHMAGASQPEDAHLLDSRALDARGRSADKDEGIASFLERRPASFPDRVSAGLPDIFPAAVTRLS